MNLVVFLVLCDSDRRADELQKHLRGMLDEDAMNVSLTWPETYRLAVMGPEVYAKSLRKEIEGLGYKIHGEANLRF